MASKIIGIIARISGGLARRARAIYYGLIFKRIGSGCQIMSGIIVKNPHDISIGNNVCLNEGVILHSCDGASITIEDNVVLSFGVMVLTGGLDLSKGHVSDQHVAAPVVVREGAWIGAGSIILPAVTIGSEAVVAAGSTVTKDVEARSVVGGVPAKRIRMLGEYGKTGGGE